MLSVLFGNKSKMVTAETALPGRDAYGFSIPTTHAVLGSPMQGPWPRGSEVVAFAMGCFWGAERILWNVPGVISTQVGYAGGFTDFPTYEETCGGKTGHTEVVQVVYDPGTVTFEALLKVFWENHDPTQGMRQGNDQGTQYRSAIYTTTPEQLLTARASAAAYGPQLRAAGHGDITTEIRGDAGPVYLAEGYHQQYLAKNPQGYCGLGGTGVSCPIGLAT